MKEKLYRIFHPSGVVAIVESIVIGMSMIYLIKFEKFGTNIAFLLYLVMSFCFVCVCIKMYDIVHTFLINAIQKNKYLKRYYEDYKIKYRVSLILSLSISVIYALFKLVCGIAFNSLWLISFAIYYGILIALRANIVTNELKKEKTLKDEYSGYRRVGIILLGINIFLSIVVLIIVNGKKLKEYNEIIAIAVACYTFYLMINSIVVLVKYRKYKSPLMSASKIINVVNSMVSMLSLEIIMLSTFGAKNIEVNKIMIMATGGIISIIIICIFFRSLFFRCSNIL